MKYLSAAIFSVFLLAYPIAKAQQSHFVYIQTENKQPFYVKLEKNLFSSTVSGYLIIPKLTDGSYNLFIGFPKGEGGEQKINCVIDKKDVGYLLKNFGDKGWGLFNLQTMEVAMSAKNKEDNLQVVEKTDAFSTMLSNVVNDPTIRQGEKDVVESKPTAGKDVNAGSVLQIDTVKAGDNLNTSNTPINTVKKEEPVEKTSEQKNTQPVTASPGLKQETGTMRSEITKYFASKNTDGVEMGYIDDTNGARDTVRIFIIADQIAVPLIENKAKTNDTMIRTIDSNKKEKAEPEKFLEIVLPNPNQKVEEAKEVEKKNSIDSSESNKMITRPVMVNSDCKKLASDEDFLKLRKKMVSENTEDDMITISKKSFKAKCYTVEQVKNLSSLFLKDSGKYAFFDMAYPFVSDSQNFPILSSQLTDKYYISRFQVMIRH